MVRNAKAMAGKLSAAAAADDAARIRKAYPLIYTPGSVNENLPGFFVLCPCKPVVGPQLWSNSFLPGIFQGTHINNKTVDPKSIIRDINNRYLPTYAQREQLDLLQQLNQLH